MGYKSNWRKETRTGTEIIDQAKDRAGAVAFARALGVSVAYVTNVVREDRRSFSESVAIKLRDQIGLPLAATFSRHERVCDVMASEMAARLTI